MIHDTQYHGRRGLGIHAISAVDMALYDLAGKQLGRPAYQLLGGACREKLRPYATIWPGSPNGRTIGEVMDNIASLFEQALALGFRAVKMEVVFGDLVDDRELERCIRKGRELLGPDITMLVDFGYRWTHWRDAARSWRISRNATSSSPKPPFSTTTSTATRALRRSHRCASPAQNSRRQCRSAANGSSAARLTCFSPT